MKKSCSFIFEELLALADSEVGFIGQLVELDGKEMLFIHSLSQVSWCRASDVLYDSYEKGELYIASENNVFGKVISAGKFVLMNDYIHHTNPLGMPPGHPILRRFLGLPIKVGDEVVGIIGLANKSVDYTEEDAAFFQPLLDTLGTLFYALEMGKSRQSIVEKLRYLAETDALTNLPNRRVFVEKLSSIGQGSFSPFTIAILDIDFFKAINDEHGHQIGDEVLAEVAHRLSREIRPSDFIARIGGEEFGLYL
ncbi:sensor domain-containing diguanylate cyclase, partial [Halomonas sp. HAL1]|uniref:sensor domain-containing diguanylate cyclase n=1 Tax=Halomonas sp. HAL1 TaxID=550984 RepID=UPI00308379E8